MRQVLKEGWRDERADMIKVLAFLVGYFVLMGGAIVIVWTSGYHVAAALLAGFEVGDWHGYFKARSRS